MVFFSSFFQEPLNGVALSLISYHDMVVEVQLLVLVVVFSFYQASISFSGIWTTNFHGKFLEFFWTVVPSMILLLMGISSVWCLFLIDDSNAESDLSVVKITGNQWYWVYSSEIMTDDFSFTSFPSPINNIYEHFLLCVEGVCFTESGLINFSGTSSDVLHAFAIPSLGIKFDCVPGKINSLSCFVNDGLFYGQCSELCGVSHSNMPIILAVN